MVQALSGRPVTAETWAQSPAISCGICGGGNGTSTGFSSNTLVSPCQ
jgi:hypothetical protein